MAKDKSNTDCQSGSQQARVNGRSNHDLLCKVARCVATTCARGTGTHGEFLNLHTEVFFCVPSRATHHTTHTPHTHNTTHNTHHNTQHHTETERHTETDRDRQKQRETERDREKQRETEKETEKERQDKTRKEKTRR